MDQRKVWVRSTISIKSNSMLCISPTSCFLHLIISRESDCSPHFIASTKDVHGKQINNSSTLARWKEIMLHLALGLSNCSNYCMHQFTPKFHCFNGFFIVNTCKEDFKVSYCFRRDDWVSKLNLKLGFCYQVSVAKKWLELCLSERLFDLLINET